MYETGVIFLIPILFSMLILLVILFGAMLTQGTAVVLLILPVFTVTLYLFAKGIRVLKNIF